MLEERDWKEFQDAGLFWWCNRILHLFGWVLVLECKHDGTILRVYPARTKFRGFDARDESAGFVQLTEYLRDNVDKLLADVKE